MSELVFSWAQDRTGKIVHVDSVSQGLKCDCVCPHCKEQLLARHGDVRAHGFAHHSDCRRANLKICYMVIMYKLAEQIIQQTKKIYVPSYFGVFEEKVMDFVEVSIDSCYERIDKQPDVIATTSEGEKYLIEFTFAYKVQHKEKLDYKNLNCLEIDLSRQSLESLHEFLLHSAEDRQWINNQNYFDNIELMYAGRNICVEVTDEKKCRGCSFKYRCCGIKISGTKEPIVIENSGNTFRICKPKELEESRERQRREHLREIDELKKCKIYREHRLQQLEKEQEQKKKNVVEETEEEQCEFVQMKNSEALENFPTQKTCFMCKRNLEWMYRGDNIAHCGSASIMGVPKNTPPDTAKTCKGFKLKGTK